MTKLKNILAVGSLIMCLVLPASCGQGVNGGKSQNPGSQPEAEPAWYVRNVKVNEVLENGYYAEQFGVNSTLYAAVVNPDGEKTDWRVYIVDDELSDKEI